MKKCMNDDIHVIILFDVVEANESGEVRILDEIIRRLEGHRLGGKLFHVSLCELWG
jgi:hypothetical protein